MPQEDYKLDLEVFEGPLDLLLYLIKREELNIYDIPIEKVTTQYMEYLGLMQMLDLNIAGEFIVMAATLMLIKSRMLLPVEDRVEEEPEEDDPRWDLVRQLVEYKKFKDAAGELEERELLQENIFAIGGRSVILEPEDPGLVLHDISLFDLIAAFREVLARAKPEEIAEIFAHTYTVADKIDQILVTLRTVEAITFQALFPARANRYEVICTFLALLELLRLRQVDARQSERFGEIEIRRIPDAAPLPGMAEAGTETGDAAHE